MKYKAGDKLICKRSSKGTDQSPELEKGKVYIIDHIQNTGCGYYSISNYYFYSNEDISNALQKLMKTHPNGGSIGISGIGPSFDINIWFYSIKEVRKEKLIKIGATGGI